MSTILSEKKTLSPWAKGGIGLGAGALLLVLVGLLFPTAAAFFPLVSLWCSCVLFYGALWVLHTAGVELDFFHRAAIIAFWAGAVLYFYWALGRRQFIYAWDYVNYIQKQFNTEAAFALGPVAGDVAGDGGDGQHLQLGRGEGQQQGHGVIHAGVAVDDQGQARHRL